MPMELIKPLNISSGVAALVAAGMWFRSATVAVPHDGTPNGLSVDGIIADDGTDFLKTIQASSRWSKNAAIAAGVAALVQSIIAFIQ